MEETTENRKGLRDDDSLACGCAKDGGKDVKDTSMEVGFDYRGEDVGGIDKGFEGDLDKGDCFIGELGAD